MPDKTKVLKTLDDLIKQPSLDYYTLMNRHRFELVWAKRWFKSKKVSEKVKEIKRRAIVKFVRNISENEPVNSWHARFSYPALYDAIRYIYDYGRKDSPWQMILNDADIKVLKTSREWTLKKLLEFLEELGDSPQDFCHTKVYEKDSYLCMKSRKLFGKYGKAVLLTGIDFNSLPKINPKKHRFSQSDFRLIINDTSLSKEEKSKYLFQGLSMQYYPVFENPSFVGREFDNLTDENSFSYKMLLRDICIGNNNSSLNGDDLVLRLCYTGDLNPRFYSADFSFRDVNSGFEARKFCRDIQSLVDFRMDYFSDLL